LLNTSNEKSFTGLSPNMRSKSVANLYNLKNDLQNKKIENSNNNKNDKKRWNKDLKDFEKYDLLKNDVNNVKEKFANKSLINNRKVNDNSIFKPMNNSKSNGYLPQPVGFHLNKSKTTELD